MKETFKINKIPSITWNWLKINHDEVTIDTKFVHKNAVYDNLPEGFTIGKNNTKIDFDNINGGLFTKHNLKTPDKRAENYEKQKENSKNNCESISEQNHPLAKIIAQAAFDAQLITVNGTPSKPLALYISNGSESNVISNQFIYAKENSECTVIFVYENNEKLAAESSLTIQTKIYAEKNAKVHVLKVQLYPENTLLLDDTGYVAMENSDVKFTQIELGGGHSSSGLYVSLQGYKSSFSSDVAYICKNRQILDMNHIVIHKNKKTKCKMNVNGSLKDEASKTYRGTIELKKGCAGSVGYEMEETLLLSPKTANKSIPVILCDEEDVEGEHGSTIGRLSSDILFYMQTRGISAKEAEKIMSVAKVQAVADKIPDENIKQKILNFIENK